MHCFTFSEYSETENEYIWNSKHVELYTNKKFTVFAKTT